MSNRYSRRVGEAYDWDLAAVGRDDDETVAAGVGEWERAQGLETTGWAAEGEEQRDPSDDQRQRAARPDEVCVWERTALCSRGAPNQV